MASNTFRRSLRDKARERFDTTLDRLRSKSADSAMIKTYGTDIPVDLTLICGSEGTNPECPPECPECPPECPECPPECPECPPPPPTPPPPILNELAESKKIEAFTSEKENVENTVIESLSDTSVAKKKERLWSVGFPHTIQYACDEHDTLAAIAARYNMTVSELRKLNRLMSDMLFPGQVLYVPDPEFTPSHERVGNVTFTYPDTHGPGIAQPLSPGGTRVLSDAEAEQLAEETPERYIKVQSYRITDGQGVVQGYLLITPNSFMFDPLPSDPLVKEHGMSTYSLSAPMTEVITVGMYRDIAAMNTDQLPQDYQAPQLYHSKSKEEKVAEERTKAEFIAASDQPLDAHITQLNITDRGVDNNWTVTAPQSIPGKGLTLPPSMDHGISPYGTSYPEGQSRIVDFSSGLFATSEQERIKVKDVSEVVMNTPPDLADKPKTIAEKYYPNVLKKFDKIYPRPAEHYTDLPMYLCLRLGTPKQPITTTGTHQNLIKKDFKDERFWFSVPKGKVDKIYAFVRLWRPEVYGDLNTSAEERGFVVNSSPQEEDFEVIDDHYSLGRRFSIDWELISADELKRRLDMSQFHPPELLNKSNILQQAHIYHLTMVLPSRIVGYPWRKVFDTCQHGFSLNTLYRRSLNIDTPALLIIQDTDSQVFGALLTNGPKVSDHFYGTGETFIFTFVPEFKKYGWTGENNFFIKGNHECLTIGSGSGSFGLWLDNDLYRGRSQLCSTFDNDPLVPNEDFICKSVEVWAFL